MEWKPIVWYEWLYEVSDEWVRSLKFWIRPLKICYIWRYPKVILYKKWSHDHTVHRLVAIAFVPNPDNLPEVDHINNDKNDFRACNLQWVTRKQNMRKAFKDKIIPLFWEWKKWKSHPRSKIILQKTISGLIIREWDNALIASKELNIQQPSISKACRGKRISAWGFKWEFL